MGEILDVEAFVFTGGSSRRMGTDKAHLRIDGETLANRTARLLSELGMKVTAVGSPIDGYAHIADLEPGSGPLAALAAIKPERSVAFLISCDLPQFNGAVARFLVERLTTSVDACLPVLGEKPQFLCGAYWAGSLRIASDLAATGERRMTAFADRLKLDLVHEVELVSAGIHLDWVRQANTPEEFAALTEPEAPR